MTTCWIALLTLVLCASCPEPSKPLTQTVETEPQRSAYGALKSALGIIGEAKESDGLVKVSALRIDRVPCPPRRGARDE